MIHADDAELRPCAAGGERQRSPDQAQTDDAERVKWDFRGVRAEYCVGLAGRAGLGLARVMA